jgi:hypothetical protein
MMRKPLEIPPDAARAFVRDMKAYFRTKDLYKRTEIAAKQSWLLQQHMPHGTRVRIGEVRELFARMRDQT